MRAPTVVNVEVLCTIEINGLGVWEFCRITAGGDKITENSGSRRELLRVLAVGYGCGFSSDANNTRVAWRETKADSEVWLVSYTIQFNLLSYRITAYPSNVYFLSRSKASGESD